MFNKVLTYLLTNLTFASHIRRVAAGCHWQICQLWKVRQLLSVHERACVCVQLGFAAMAYRMARPPSLSCDRKWPRL